MLSRLKRLYQRLLSEDKEQKKILRLVEENLTKSDSILEVGCGYGRLLKPLHQKGYKVLGIEANRDIVQANLNNQLPCTDVDAFERQGGQFDAIIMSHIIEHFTPSDLIVFFKNYLQYLKAGGLLIIATPLYTTYFYDDFDHVKPYHPESIQMMFSKKNSQIKFNSEKNLNLRYIWFRKSPLLLRKYSPMYQGRTIARAPLLLINLLMVFLDKVSFGLLSRKDGWVGVFAKV